MRVLFVPFGSEGDVNPLIWLAEGLSDRGHEVHFLITPHYARLVESRGFTWTPMGTEEDFTRFARDPRLWAPRTGPYAVIKGMKETLGHYEGPFAAVGPCDLVVLSTVAMAASTLAEARGIPRLTLHMQPACVRSAYDCPLFVEELAWFLKMPVWVKKSFFWMIDQLLWNLARPSVNAFRERQGLPPIRNFYDEGLQGSEGVAALFPDWFSPPQRDWPRGLRQFGFPINPQKGSLPPAVADFISAGEPPVVWTHGSANFDIAHFQEVALRVSRELGLRCILVSLDAPRHPLPPSALHISHVRFEDLFPHCAAVVHHGGIGTTAKVIAAGVPQLIIPRSHDQPDNAYRVTRLGLGRSLRYSQLGGPEVARTLRALLDDQGIKDQCRHYQRRIFELAGRDALCDWCEQLAKSY